MIRPRTALAAVALAAITAAGCGGSKDATEGDVRDDVRDRLLETGFVAPETDPDDAVEVDENDAEDIGICVARTMFESTDEFSKDERNAATSVSDGDDPDPDLVLKVEALVADCYEEVVGGGGTDDEAQTSDEDDEGTGADEETTTTEG